MGGLRKHMPWTFATFLIGAISIAGIWPLAGFWSKDEIIVSSQTMPVLFALAMITVFMTAFYMFRAVFMTFMGEYRGGAPAEEGGHDSHAGHGPHESSWVMVIPLVILSILAICAGWWNVTGGFNAFMGHAGHGEQAGFFANFFGVLSHPLPLISLIVAILGIFLAYAMYIKKWISAEKVGRIFKPLYTLFSRKYYMDELYENVIVRKVLYGGIFRACAWFDSHVIDGLVNGLARGTGTASTTLRKAETGQLQLYGLTIIIGIIAIVVCLLIFG
jgi:NADH-quinone oxidoreductase subunit L